MVAVQARTPGCRGWSSSRAWFISRATRPPPTPDCPEKQTVHFTNVKPEPPPDPSNPVMARSFPAHPEAERMSEERRLIARAQSGDTGAFRELVDRHRARAYTLALRILRSPSDAEEVAQDAFVRVWTALLGFRGESSFGTWLYRIVARRAFDRAQVLKHRRARERQDERLPEPHAPEQE